MPSSSEGRSPYNNEIKFCKVYTKAAKQELERVFLRHRISYFVEWGQESIWQRLFPSKDGHIHCTICINKADFAEARALAKGIRDVRVRNMVGLEERDPVKDLKRKKEIKENIEQKKTKQPVIRKTSGGMSVENDRSVVSSSARTLRPNRSGRSQSAYSSSRLDDYSERYTSDRSLSGRRSSGSSSNRRTSQGNSTRRRTKNTRSDSRR